jgi:5'-nucleotidase
MKVLLTNDDGIQAEGLMALVDVFMKNHEVSVIAPDRERSAIGHGITLNAPLRVESVKLPHGIAAHAVNGTPADCIKLAIVELLHGKPDMVIAGINPGANVGVNLNYSGTVAAAKEATLYGIPALAVSMAGLKTVSYAEAARFVEKLSQKVHQEGLPEGTFLNINLPNLPFGSIRGIKLSRQGNRLFPEYFEKRVDPRNRIYYWQGCDSPPQFDWSDIDCAVLHDHYISITPIQCDMTDHQALNYLKQWGLENGFKDTIK